MKITKYFRRSFIDHYILFITKVMKHSSLLAIIILLSVPDLYAQVSELRQGDYYSESKAREKLAEFAATYNSKETWTARAAMIRENIRKGARLENLPGRCALNPIRTNLREFDGYTVENVAFESLPGFYVTGNLYLPKNHSGKIPGIACPHGHWENPADYGRFRIDMQYRCATLASMGAAVFAYDMLGYGESSPCLHENPEAVRLQTWNSIRVIDFLLSLGFVDEQRLAVTGASGGGTQSFLLAALDDRIDVSVPVVMVSAHFFGGCTCESGMPIHKSGNFETNNAEIAACIAPKPLLLISDGDDWTRNNPEVEYPYVKNIYKLFGAGENVENAHLANEVHDYGFNKRIPMYRFMARHLGLDLQSVTDSYGLINESNVHLLEKQSLEVFPGNVYPKGKVTDCAQVLNLMNTYR